MSKKQVNADLAGNKSACEETKTPQKDVCCVCGTSEDVKRCGRCKLTSYCSGTCQKSHNSYHKRYCAAIADLQKLEMDKLYKDHSVRQKYLDWKTERKMMKLVGEKPILACLLDGKKLEMLWDTGSMVSLVGRDWVKRHFPEKKIYSVNDFLENEELHLRAANATEIQFDGVILVDFALSEKDDGFTVPVLVASQDVTEPLLGYNVIEQLVLNGSVQQRVALKTAWKEKKVEGNVSSLVSLIEERAKDPDYLTDVRASSSTKVPAGRRIQVKCRVKSLGNSKEQTVYFAPSVTESDDDLTFSETVCQLKRGRTNYVTVDVMNLSKVDRVLPKGRIIGSIHGVAAVIPMVKIADGKRDSKMAKVGCVVDKTTDSEESRGKREWDLSHLDERQRAMVEEVLRGEEDMFSKTDDDIGAIADFQMPVHVVDQIPVTAAYRKIPPHLYKEVKDYISDLVTNGWIRESHSSYSSPIVCVRKKDGGMRMCVDYRKLNAKTVPDSQPIPRIQDILDVLGGQKWFSTLDMSKAYHQGYIEEKYRYLTAFVTPWTLYEWIRIPFGLRNAPPAFQRYINRILGDLKGVICEPYLDDVLCFSKTFEDHVKDLQRVLRRLKARGVKLRAEKCVFAKREVRYLGRLVSADGYRPDPADTAALEKFRAPPKTVGELRSLVGFLGYYRSYVRDFSKQVKPLYELLKVTGGEKDTKVGKKAGQRHDSKESIKWTDIHQQILEKMINYLQSPEVISYPSFDLPFFITCDASSKGLGAVLYQNQEGVDRVISYASRTLSEAEKNYHLHSGKLEFLGLKWAITERFSNYLRYGPPFVVYTDNNPLT